ncbi:MAG TPA: OsmC family protein [Terracidiphilus sp.]|nr:OsmC family protein [Terracidiphilus sp.]
MAGSTHIKLVQSGPAKFVVSNAAGATGVIDGPADMGGENAGLRPTEMLLAALAGCSSLDVLHIMKKKRQSLERLEVEVDAERADAIPAVFTKIHLRFKGYGAIELEKLQKAVDLSMEKYCSVSKMLEPTVKITAEGVLG